MADPAALADRDLKREASAWIEKLEAAKKRQDDWEKDAHAAEHAYSAGMKIAGGDGGSAKVYDFNIVHSNVETIVPAVYNSTPVPDIRPRWATDDEAVDKIVKEFGAAMERTISTQIDDNRLDKEIESGTRDAYLAGRGVVRLRFEADEGEPEVAMDPETGEPVEDRGGMVNERITFEAVSWRDFRMGPARRWENVPWIAFAHRLPQEEVDEFENPDYVAPQRAKAEKLGDAGDGTEECTIWEVWCKKTRSVKWIKEDGSELIREDDDPLGLPGFFPIPEPVQPLMLTGMMTPICPAKIYEKLASEMDTITKRIARITSGLKVRGIIIGSAEDIAALAELDDWELHPGSMTLEQLGQMKGLDGAITWWPLDKAVAVLKHLYEAREQAKMAIYEITGISDIVRGASDARETLGAQEIKTQWGALRIQRMQKLIERQVRDLFVMMVDVIARNFRPERIAELTGLEITDEVRALMDRPMLAHYRVDVESDSTVRADLTRAKGEMSEFLQGTGAFFQSMATVVEAAPETAEPVTEIYASFARVFRLGKQAEDAIEKLTAIAKQSAGQPRPNPEAEKLQAEMQLKQGEMEMKAQEAQQKAALDAEKLGLEREKAEADVQVKHAELALKQADLQIKDAELRLKEQQLAVDAANAEADREARRAEADANRKAKASEKEAA